jgi:hypothetical protein
MSVLQVSNIHFESTGNNRIQYIGSNSFVFVTAGSNAIVVNTSAITYITSPSFSSLIIGNSVITNTNITVGNSTVITNTNITVGNSTVITNTNITVGNSTVNGSLSNISIRVGNSTNSFTTNSTGIYHTGTINLSSYTVGSAIIANSTMFTLANTVGLQANGSVGSAGDVLTSNGSVPYWAALAAGSLIGIQSLTSGTTYTKTTGTNKIIAIGIGGGAGQRSITTDVGCGPVTIYYGGGAGGTFISYVNMSAANTLPYTIGAAGATQSNGGITTLGTSSTYGYASGGVSSTTANGGISSNGTMNIVGGRGQLNGYTPTIEGIGFFGGSGSYGSGGRNGINSGVGFAGVILIFEFA